MSEPAANICVVNECRKVWQVTRLVVIPAAKVATRKNFRTPIGCKWYLQISPVRGWMQYLGEGNRNAMRVDSTHQGTFSAERGS